MRALLVANRGEIAVRIMRTATAMGVRTVAVYTDADADAVHVEAADEAVPIGAASAYLDAEALVHAAAVTGADAVHPGYGFLAEQAGFARAVLDAGLTWVGPAPEAIAAMGDKVRARALMAAAGVPVISGLSPGADGAPIDAAAAAALGYPLLVKAAAGGGGRGMRIVREAADLDAAVAAAQREAAAAFGDATVFVERYIERARHVEAQVLGDGHGTVIHLGERECSIQRRHQKVIEEAPSPAVDEGLRAALGAAATTAAAAIGYAGAGTVEFLLTPDGEFAFLEMNTRLQVEHPVTELAWRVKGNAAPLDLVRLQLEVAQGAPLPFGQDDLELAGHAIEARLYAEDPANGYLPTAGRLAVWQPDPGVRWDSGVRAGSEVGIDYDPLLAKAVAFAPTRAEAAARLAAALDATRVHGVATNRDLLVAVLRDPDFLAGATDTAFLDEHADLATAVAPTRPVHAVAATLCAARRRDRARLVQSGIPSGWRNNPSQSQRVEFAHGVTVTYLRRRDGRYEIGVGESALVAEVRGWPDERGDDRVDLVLDGRRLRIAVTPGEDGATWYVDSVLGHETLRVSPRFPRAAAEQPAGSLHAPMPGTALAVPVALGDAVARGDVVVVLEAMKMEHRVTAPHDGTIAELRVAAGDRVAAGEILAVIDRAEGSGDDE